MNCTFLSFCVPARPGIAKDLIEADDIGRKAVVDFLVSLLVENLSFTTPIKCYKKIKFRGLRGQEKKLSNIKTILSQMKA